MSSNRWPGGGRLPRDMTVHPFHRIGGGERQRSGQNFVQRDAERVEVAARVERPSGLFGSHIGKVQAMTSGGAGTRRSRGSCDAMPKPVSRTVPAAASTSRMAGLMSLCVRPWRCTWRSAAAMLMPRRNARGRSGGPGPRIPPSGSPSGSSRMSLVRPSCRTRANGRTEPNLVQVRPQTTIHSQAGRSSQMTGSPRSVRERSSATSPILTNS
jgi:hypothetical protein